MASSFDRMREDKRKRDAAEYERRMKVAKSGGYGPKVQQATRRSRLQENRARHQAMQARRWRKEKVPGSGNRYRVVSDDGRVHGIYDRAEADRVLRMLRKQQGK